MKRQAHRARENWQALVERDGLRWHSEGGLPCWNESAVYLFSPAEIELIRRTAREVHGLYLEAAAHVVERGLWSHIGLRHDDASIVKLSWERGDWSLHGRFDFLIDEAGQPRLLEYNAETALSLVESSLVQLNWQKQVMPAAGQFNSLHAMLVDAWCRSGIKNVHCAWRPRHPEVEGTVLYMAGVVREAGLQATMQPLHRIGWDRRAGCFVDSDGAEIECCYKVYPWEWMLREPFAKHAAGARCGFVEPAWRLLHGSKGMLAVLWSLFPDHPALVPCFHNPDSLGNSFVSKPMFGREGRNISIRREGVIAEETQGENDDTPRVFQAFVKSPLQSGCLAQLGVWMVENEPAALSIRESPTLILTDNSSCVPHAMVNENP